VQNLPGRPDVVFPKAKVVVFVDGDFWHGYDFDKWEYKLTEFWKVKIQKNIERDKKNSRLLEEQGWKVLRFWEHEIKTDLNGCIDKVINLLAKPE
jgi:DNA mismatch endonuclease (patch repair protein)